MSAPERSSGVLPAVAHAEDGRCDAANDDAARYAAALLDAAVDAFRCVPPAEREAAGLYAALDTFLAAPGPVTFLAARRVLGAAARARRLAPLRLDAARRGLARGLDALAHVPHVDAAIAARLADLPVDPRAAERLAALTALLDAWQELSARVAGAAAAFRRQMSPSSPASASAAPAPRPRLRARRAASR